MKTLMITLMTLALLVFGLLQAQSKDMQMKDDMKSMDGMMEMDGKMGTDSMSDEKMKMDGMHKKMTVIPTDAELRKTLTPMQYKVTRQDGTEPPFNNAYWNNHEPGLYVDVISGVPLFSSTDKYDSGTGWPSFTRPLDPAQLVELTDSSLFMTRIEVRSKVADAHLGHVFNDGPAPTGLRYCMNSAALRFIPLSDLVDEGYGEYVNLFK